MVVHHCSALMDEWRIDSCALIFERLLGCYCLTLIAAWFYLVTLYIAVLQ